ncbi:MAG: hypothetical protein FWD26_02065 [Treponema sp.]|nr:hypothetical protein [Treponema sp.]
MIKKILFFVLLVFSFTMLFAFGSREKAAPTIQVTGIVRLVGTSLFPEIVISGAETEWHAVKEEMDKLHDLQHQTVTVEAEETIIELRFANGMPAGIRRELKNIKIIKIH